MNINVQRVLATHILYQLELRAWSFGAIEEYLDRFLQSCSQGEYAFFEDQRRYDAAHDYMRHLVQAYADHAEEIDDLLITHLRGWTLERLPALERASLRVAVAELIYTEAPTAAAIAECLKFIERYADPERKKYINGVLGNIARDLGLQDKGRLDLNAADESERGRSDVELNHIEENDVALSDVEPNDVEPNDDARNKAEKSDLLDAQEH